MPYANFASLRSSARDNCFGSMHGCGLWFLGLALVSIVICASAAQGASYSWQISTGDWSIASNWGGTLPTSNDISYITNGGTAAVTQLGETCGTLSLGSGAGNGTVQMTGGSLAATSYEYVGFSGTGAFTQSGGTNNCGSGGLYLGYNSGSRGSYNLNGSGLLSTSAEYIGYGSSSTGTFTQSGGTNMVTSVFWLAGTGTYNLTGGALSLPGIQGTGTLNLGGGTLVANAAFCTAQPLTLTGSGGNGNINTGNYPITLSGLLSGPGGLNLLGAGALTLTASDTYTGSTAISAGTLQVGNGGSGEFLASPSVSLGNSAALVFDHADVLTYSGVISGSGNLTQTGAGILTLTRNNTYNGNTAISAGTLQVGNGGSGEFLASPSVSLSNSAALVFNHADALTYSGLISGNGSLTQTGGGMLTLTGSSTYSGGTTIISANELQVGNGGSGASIGSTSGVLDNSSLVFNHSDAVTFSPAISGNGILTQTGTGILMLAGSNTKSFKLSVLALLAAWPTCCSL